MSSSGQESHKLQVLRHPLLKALIEQNSGLIFLQSLSKSLHHTSDFLSVEFSVVAVGGFGVASPTLLLQLPHFLMHLPSATFSSAQFASQKQSKSSVGQLSPACNLIEIIQLSLNSFKDTTLQWFGQRTPWCQMYFLS